MAFGGMVGYSQAEAIRKASRTLQGPTEGRARGGRAPDVVRTQVAAARKEWALTWGGGFTFHMEVLS